MGPNFKKVEEALIVNEAFRVAPARNGERVASYWRFWTSGNEIYANNLLFGANAKISVHASGQIHCRIEKRTLQKWAPPIPLGNGDWLHAFELRFLIGDDTLRPPPETFKKGQPAFTIEAPPKAVVFFNLLVGQWSVASPPPLPREFLPNGKAAWRATLTDQRPVAMIVRVMPMDAENAAQLRHFREEQRLRTNFSSRPTNFYLELRFTSFHPTGGNVIIVAPLGKESLRVLDELPRESGDGLPFPARQFTISSPDSSARLLAPNGAEVGTLTFSGQNRSVELQKNIELHSELGSVTLLANFANLITGEKFECPTVSVQCLPTVAGAQPRDWAYKIITSFDGVGLQVDIRPQSVSLRNGQVDGTMPSLQASEELLMSAPIRRLTLRAVPAAPKTSSPLPLSLALLDHS